MRGTECLCKSSIIIHYLADDSRNMSQQDTEWNKTPVVQGVWPAASPWPILSATLSVSVPSRFIKHNVPWRCTRRWRCCLTKCDATVSGSIPTFRIIHACHSKEVPAFFLPPFLSSSLSLSISQLLYAVLSSRFFTPINSAVSVTILSLNFNIRELKWRNTRIVKPETQAEFSWENPKKRDET